MYFKCLNNKSVLEAKISDHEPVIDGSVCVWNIMCRGNGKNNYFYLTESPDEYRQRLLKINQVVNELKQAGIEVFMFQEAPQLDSTDDPTNTFYNDLKKIPGFQPLDTENITNTQGIRSALFTIADYTRFPIQNNVTLNHPSSIAGRIQALNLKEANKPTVTLFNIHGDFLKPKETSDTVYTLLGAQERYIVGGDFNLPEDGHHYLKSKGIFVKAKYFDTFDGLMGTSPVANLIPKIHSPVIHAGLNQSADVSKANTLQSSVNAASASTSQYQSASTYQNAINDFMKRHSELFIEEKTQCFIGFFRRTQVKPNMTLAEIIAHAQTSNNRSRRICVEFNWIDNEGTPNPQIEQYLQDESYVAYRTAFGGD